MRLPLPFSRNAFFCCAFFFCNEFGYCGEATVVVSNPTASSYTDTAVRLPLALDASWGVSRGGTAPALVASQAGRPVPTNVVEEDGAWWVVVRDDVPANSNTSYQVKPGTSPTAVNPVRIQRDGAYWLMDNGLMAVKVPVDGVNVGPIAGIRLGNRWVGSSHWEGIARSQLTSQVVADGHATAAIRLRFTFSADPKMIFVSPQTIYSEIVLRLDPGAQHVEIQERHHMYANCRWVLRLAEGWTPTQGFSKPFWGGPGDDGSPAKPAADRPLTPFPHPAKREDLFLAILPRWNQHWKDGWRAGVGDGQDQMHCIAMSASRWVWPHDNALELSVLHGGQLLAPSQRGRRVWWLTTGGSATAPAYLARWGWNHPSRLSQLPGAELAKNFSAQNPYDGGAINPTGGVRRLGREALAKAGTTVKDRDSLFLRTMDWIHPDVYGSYWLGWSPENPNFFSDFSAPAVGWAAQLTDHPRFPELAALIKARLQEDLYHTVTLARPVDKARRAHGGVSGAGQECPGYARAALQHVLPKQLAVADKFFSSDFFQDPRFISGSAATWRQSQPDGAIRRELPMGDTHPSKDGPWIVPPGESPATSWTSEEWPGFGAILRHRCGTPQETYLAFKAGPNRGHYHGDQLAIHLAFHARAAAVDHHCSYKPRAGQEHLHNRMSFSAPGLPFANMDGYERLLGFSTHPLADIAVAQVESPRLRATKEYPMEFWHQEWPQQVLTKPLVYRRTVILLKGVADGQDAVVLRDQWHGADGLTATYNLHVRSDTVAFHDSHTVFGNVLRAERILPVKASSASFAWQHSNGGGESTHGVRWSVQGNGEMLTVLLPGSVTTPVKAIDNGVMVGSVKVMLTGFYPDLAYEQNEPIPAVTVVAANGTTGLLYDNLDLLRDQGDVGLFVPDAGYPFGPIPHWLINARATLPPFAPAWARRLRDNQP